MAKKRPNEKAGLIDFSHDLLRVARRSTGALSRLDEAGRRFVLARYRKFLALAKLYPQTSLVPTGDIDEMWHVHMLIPDAYANDCLAYFGEVLRHNGDIHRTQTEVARLIRLFDRTADLWQSTFGEAYIPSRANLPQGFAAIANSVARCHSM